MIEKLKLSFCLSSDLATPEMEEEAARFFRKERGAALENFASGLNLSSGEAGLLAFAKKYLETPEILHPLFEPRAQKELATLAQNKIPRLFEAIDKAAFELTKEGVEPEAAFLLSKRLERLRAEFEVWREAIRIGNFEVRQTRPYEKMPEHFEQIPALRNQYRPNLTGLFPARVLSVPWNPAAAKVKKEPEEFRQIWLNPEEDIPKVFEALERAGFIDSQRKWIAPEYLNNPGGVIDALKDKRPPLLHNLSRPKLIEAFGKRLGFPYEGKRYEAKNTPYDEAKKQINRHLS